MEKSFLQLLVLKVYESFLFGDGKKFVVYFGLLWVFFTFQ